MPPQENLRQQSVQRACVPLSPGACSRNKRRRILAIDTLSSSPSISSHKSRSRVARGGTRADALHVLVAGRQHTRQCVSSRPRRHTRPSRIQASMKPLVVFLPFGLSRQLAPEMMIRKRVEEADLGKMSERCGEGTAPR